MHTVSNWFKNIFSDAQMTMLFVVLLIGVIGLTLLGNMLAPAIGAVVIAFLLDGPVHWLERKGLSHILAVTVVFLLFCIFSLIAVFTVIPPLFDQIVQFVNLAPSFVVAVKEGVLEFQDRVPDLISEEQVLSVSAKLADELANLGPRIIGISAAGVSGFMTAAVYMVLIPVMVFFFMKDKRQILAWISSFIPPGRALVDQVWQEFVARTGDYARGKVYEILIVGTAAFILYQILGLRFATLLAVATGLSVIIPYIGAAVITIPVAMVAYFQWGSGSEFMVAVIGYLILQALDGNVLVPLLFSEVVKLHPNAIIISILIFGGIWGLWGVFFAIPLATMANAVLRVWGERSQNNHAQED